MIELMTTEVEERLKAFPIYSQDSSESKVVVVKFYNPYGNGVWEVTEGRKLENGDYEFFGLVSMAGFGKEWEFFTLSQIKSYWANVYGVHLPMERHIQFNYKINKKGEVVEE